MAAAGWWLVTQPEQMAPDGSTVLPPDSQLPTPSEIQEQPVPASGEQNAGYEDPSTDGVSEIQEKAANG